MSNGQEHREKNECCLMGVKVRPCLVVGCCTARGFLVVKKTCYCFYFDGEKKEQKMHTKKSVKASYVALTHKSSFIISHQYAKPLYISVWFGGP